jgi:hypothetical protein
MMPRIIAILLILISNLCFASTWQDDVNKKLDGLSAQLNDGWSSELKKARKIYRFKDGERELFASLISIEGHHGGNGNVEYLVVYELGDSRPENKNDKLQKKLWLIGYAIVGGRGERFVEFDSLKYDEKVFTLNAMAYENDPMCCPSKPIVIKYELSFYGLKELESNKSLEKTTGKR